MNLTLIKQGVAKVALPAIHIIKQKSPQIFVAVGIGTGVGCVVMACKATLEVDEIIDNVAANKQKMTESLENEDLPYTEEQHQSDLVKLYVQSGIKFAKLYLPSIILGVTSITCFLSSTHILTKRNTVLVGLVSSLEQSFSMYRKRVVDEYGETKDYMYANGLYEEEVEVEYVDEKTGRKKKKKETVVNLNEGELGIYTRIYDDGNKNYSKSPESNLMFLRSIETFANDRLHTYGYVWLSDILDDLGFPETESSRLSGWVQNEEGTVRVDFGIFDRAFKSAATRDFINGYETAVLLNFNCQGYIANKIPERKVRIWTHEK